MLSWILVYVFLCRHMFPMRGIGGSYGNSIFNILRNCQTFPKQLHYFATPQAIHEGSSHLWQCFLFPFFFVVFIWWWILIKAPSRDTKRADWTAFSLIRPDLYYRCCGRQSAIRCKRKERGRDGASPGPIEADCVVELMLHMGSWMIWYW